MSLGMYIARGNQTCQQRPGTLYHEAADAAQFAAWNATYIKLDSCDDYGNRTAWQEYSIIADALRAAYAAASLPAPYVEVCELFPWLSIANVTVPNGDETYGNSAYTLGNWLSEGLPVDTIANALLIEWENTYDSWESTLGNFDASFFLTSRLLAFPGVANHLDMLTVCMGKQSIGQYQAQLSLWSVMGSPLILGNDFSSGKTDPACVSAVLTNGAEVIAVDQDEGVMPSSKIFDSIVSLFVSVSVSLGGEQQVALPSAGPVSVWWQVMTRPLASGETSVVIFCRQGPMSAGALVAAALGCGGARQAADAATSHVCASAAAGGTPNAQVTVTMGQHSIHTLAVRAWDEAPTYLFNMSLPTLGLPSASSVLVRDLWRHEDIGPLVGAVPVTVAPTNVAHINVRKQSSR